MEVGRSPDQEVSLYSQAFVGTSGEAGGFKSTSEGDFRDVGDEELGLGRSLDSIKQIIQQGRKYYIK